MTHEEAVEIIQLLKEIKEMHGFDAVLDKVKAKPAMLDFWQGKLDYKEMADSYGIKAGGMAHDIVRSMERMKYYLTTVEETYKDYKKRESEISNPEILQFIKDYEKENQ